MDHLLYTASEDSWNSEEAQELRVACLMGLVSLLSARVEVLSVAPRHPKHLMNAVARALIQSATITETPLTAAGLDGTGQVIQVRWKSDALGRSHLITKNAPSIMVEFNLFLVIEVNKAQVAIVKCPWLIFKHSRGHCVTSRPNRDVL